MSLPAPRTRSAGRPGCAAEQTRVTAAQISEALATGEILPWYQPIAELKTGAIVGFEALARWIGPSGGMVEPDDFIQVAERSNLILDLDLAVFTRALLDLRQWQQTRPQLRLSMNLSGGFSNDPDWAHVVCDVVDEAGMDPRSVDLELTESTRPADLPSFDLALQRLRSRGFRIWLDDIGAEWHCIAEVMNLEIDGVKMERRFATLLNTSDEDQVLAVVRDAAARGLRVTLEGIETGEQYRRVRELKIDFGQGYFWSPPIPPEEVARAGARQGG